MEEKTKQLEDKHEWLKAMGKGEIDAKDYPMKKQTKEDIISNDKN